MTWVRSQVFSQNAQFSATLVTNTIVTLGSAVAIGDTILFVTTVGGNTTTFAPTMTDQLGNTYNRLSVAQGGQLFDAGNTQSEDWWWCIATVGGTPTITYKPDAATGKWLAIKGSHFTGSDAASTRRDSKGALQPTPGNTADFITTTSIAAVAGDLLWGGSGNPGTNLFTQVGGTGFTATAIDGTSSLLDEWKTATGAGAVTSTDTANGATATYMTAGIAISPASVVITPGTQPQRVIYVNG